MIPLTFSLATLGVLFIIGMILVEIENFGQATLLLIVYGFLVQLLNVADIFSYVVHHIVNSLEYIVYYLVTGIVWSFVKWLSFLFKFRSKFREVKRDFLRNNNIVGTNVIPQHLMDSFDKYRREQYSYNINIDFSTGKKPLAIKNKSRLIAWAAFWPCSFIGTFLNDPVRRLFTFLFNSFKDLYQKLSDWVFANDPELK